MNALKKFIGRGGRGDGYVRMEDEGTGNAASADEGVPNVPAAVVHPDEFAASRSDDREVDREVEVVRAGAEVRVARVRASGE